jgi:cytochrome oxidase Cu insertion factor (SCO1/SenC/PrrC family)
LALLPMMVFASCQPPSGSPALPKNVEPALDIPVPDFSFTERSGKTVTNADLKGKVWVASFVFTRCTGPCPQMTASVARLQEELKENANIRFVTFTIDPERDSLVDLKKYAEHYRADPERWLFLTGPEKAMHDFATKGFKLLAQKNATPKPGDEFDHSSKLAVVDKAGKIRGYFDGMAPDREGGQKALEESLANLKRLAASLAVE